MYNGGIIRTSMYKYRLSTRTEGFYNITSDVRAAVKAEGVTGGICVVFCPHTTAGITINENADEYVARDVTLGVARAFPQHNDFLHDEGNSAGHVKSSMFGVSLTLIIEDGDIVLGRWQDVYFVECDPPREREFYVKIIKDK